MAESEEELKNLMMKVKEESEKAGFSTFFQHSVNEDYGIWSHHFMTDRWRNNGNSDFIFLGSKITADGTASMKLNDACSLKEKL